MKPSMLQNMSFLLGLACASALSGCVSDGSGDDWVEAPAVAPAPAWCLGQRAMVPRSGTASRTLDATNAKVSRQVMPGSYVSFQVSNLETFAIFFFAPELPANPSTEVARSMLKYAIVGFSLKQPGDVGGTLTLLSSNDILRVGDFERFEMQDGKLVWRLVRRSAERYDKELSVYDEDMTNDPVSGIACVTDDIVGMCHCPFTGPAVSVTLDGTTSLTP